MWHYRRSNEASLWWCSSVLTHPAWVENTSQYSRQHQRIPPSFLTVRKRSTKTFWGVDSSSSDHTHSPFLLSFLYALLIRPDTKEKVYATIVISAETMTIASKYLSLVAASLLVGQSATAFQFPNLFGAKKASSPSSPFAFPSTTVATTVRPVLKKPAYQLRTAFFLWLTMYLFDNDDMHDAWW